MPDKKNHPFVWFDRIMHAEPIERKTAILSFCYFFCILCSYYILRPLREEMGVAGGVANLPYLYLGTLAGMFLATPFFGALVTRFNRGVFIPVVYHFFALNLLTFWILAMALAPEQQIWLGRVFYVWISVFNLFVVTVFWGFMADVFSLERAKRLFGFIAMGGSLGGLIGAGITAFLVEFTGRVHLILVSFFFLQAAIILVQKIHRMPSLNPEQNDDSPSELSLKEAFNGVLLLLKSPYLLGMSLFLFIYTFTSTTFYFQQAMIVDSHIADRIARAAFFGQIDFAVNTLTLLIQLFLTANVIRWFGIGKTLAILPFMTVLGFLALGFWATPLAIALIQIGRRTLNFSLTRPANEALFTILTPEEKYKAKSFLDTFIYRGGDAVVASLFGLFRNAGAAMSTLAFAAAPIGLLWGMLGLWLGRRLKYETKRMHES